MEMPIRCIMFDWGGTLAHVRREQDTFAHCVAGFLEFLSQGGINPPENAQDDLLARHVAAVAKTATSDSHREFDTSQVLTDWAIDRGLTLPNGDWLLAAADAFWRPWIGCLDAIEGAVDTIQRLKSPDRAIGLVSNTAVIGPICRSELQRLGFADHLDFTVFSSEVGWRKPHDAIYRKALTQAGRNIDPATVLFVGDTPVADVDGPARFGMRTALVRTGRWGGSDAELSTSPTYILDSVADLTHALNI